MLVRQLDFILVLVILWLVFPPCLRRFHFRHRGRPLFALAFRLGRSLLALALSRSPLFMFLLGVFSSRGA